MYIDDKLWGALNKKRDDKPLPNDKLRKMMEKVGTKRQSDYAKNHPNFYKLLAEDEEIRVRLKQGLAWGEFMLDVLVQKNKFDDVRSFFVRSSTHRTLFYTLFVTALQRILHCPEGQNPDSIGQAIPEVLSVMHKAEFASDSKVRQICREAKALGLIHQTHWRMDKRHKLYWLSCKAIEAYLTDVLEEFAQATTGLPGARVSLITAMQKNPNFETDIRTKLCAAIDADNLVAKKLVKFNNNKNCT